MFWACGLPIRRHASALRSSHAKRLSAKDPEPNDPIGLPEIAEGNTGYCNGKQEHSGRSVSSSWSSRDVVSRWNDVPRLDPRSIHFGKILGRGASSTVYRATVNGMEVALKVIQNSVSNINSEPLDSYLAKHVDHPNIMKVLGVCQNSYPDEPVDTFDGIGLQDTLQPVSPVASCTSTSSDIFSDITNECSKADAGKGCETWIAMELCDRGSLREAISSGLFFEDEKREHPRVLLVLLTALEIAVAMHHLHLDGIIHGDLKSQNVMLVSSDIVAKDFVCKVGDFGLSRLLDMDISTHISTFQCGTVSHMPPEVLRDGILTPAADVFSFGMLLWELMSGKLPFLGQSFTDMMVAIVEGYRPKLPSYFPKTYSKLLTDCWSQSREARPSFAEIITRLRVMLGGPSELRNIPSSIPRLRKSQLSKVSYGRLEASHRRKPSAEDSACSTSGIYSTSEGLSRGFGQSSHMDTVCSSTASELHTPSTEDARDSYKYKGRRCFSDWSSRPVPKAREPYMKSRVNGMDTWEWDNSNPASAREVNEECDASASGVIQPVLQHNYKLDKPPTKLTSKHRVHGLGAWFVQDCHKAPF